MIGLEKVAGGWFPLGGSKLASAGRVPSPNNGDTVQDIATLWLASRASRLAHAAHRIHGGVNSGLVQGKLDVVYTR